MHKRIISIMIAILTVLLCAFGCGKPAGGMENGFDVPQYEWGNVGANRPLTIWGDKENLERPYFEKVIKLYKEKTGNSIQLCKLVAEDDVVMDAFQPNNARPDMLLWHGGTNLDGLNPAENFVDYTNAEWVSDLTDSSLNQTIYNGNVVGLTYGESSISGTLYNKKVFQKYGISVPKTQSEFLKACQTLLEHGVTPMYLPNNQGSMWSYQFPMDAFLNHDTIKKLNNQELSYADIPEMTKILDWYRTMATSGYLGANYLSHNWDGMSEAMKSGKYAMMLCWDTWLYTNYDGNPSDIGLMPAFVGEPEHGTFEGPNLMLMLANKHSTELDAVNDFITFMADPYIYNQAVEGMYSAHIFNNQLGSLATPQYREQETLINELYHDSTAWLRVKGFSQSDAKFIFEYMSSKGTPKLTQYYLTKMNDERIARIGNRTY